MFCAHLLGLRVECGAKGWCGGGDTRFESWDADGPGRSARVRRKTKVKFVLAFTVQSGGSEVERFEAVQRAQALLSEWQPSKSATIREWVSRCDGNGGFSVIETDNAAELLKDLSTWSSFLEFTVYPVVDITEATGMTAQAIAARQSIS